MIGLLQDCEGGIRCGFAMLVRFGKISHFYTRDLTGKFFCVREAIGQRSGEKRVVERAGNYIKVQIASAVVREGFASCAADDFRSASCDMTFSV
jgi:hypothetical protein